MILNNHSYKKIDFMVILNNYCVIICNNKGEFCMKNNNQVIKTSYDNAEVDQINELLIQELFRQLLIINKIAEDYVLTFEDGFEFKEDGNTGVAGTISVYKDEDGVWYVWEDINKEMIFGYFQIEHHNIKHFDNQIDAYINAAKRRKVSLSIQDFMYDEKDNQNILDIIESAKSFISAAIDFYGNENSNKLIQNHILLEKIEKQINEKKSLDIKKLIIKQY